MNEIYERVMAVGSEILTSLKAGDPGSSALRTKMQYRSELFHELGWSMLDQNQLELIGLQDQLIGEAATELESTLVKALSARMGRKKAVNPHAYGRFQDMRA